MEHRVLRVQAPLKQEPDVERRDMSLCGWCIDSKIVRRDGTKANGGRPIHSTMVMKNGQLLLGTMGTKSGTNALAVWVVGMQVLGHWSCLASFAQPES